MRREYSVSLMINGRQLIRLVIDSHYEQRHKDSINDEIILCLAQTLNGSEQLPESVDEDGFEYYVKDGIVLDDKTYKLVWLLKEDEIFIGIVNAYRRD